MEDFWRKTAGVGFTMDESSSRDCAPEAFHDQDGLSNILKSKATTTDESGVPENDRDQSMVVWGIM